jgi:hypothetical protein
MNRLRVLFFACCAVFAVVAASGCHRAAPEADPDCVCDLGVVGYAGITWLTSAAPLDAVRPDPSGEGT